MYILVLIGLDLFLPLLQDDAELNAVVIPPITSLVPEGVQLELLRTIELVFSQLTLICILYCCICSQITSLTESSLCRVEVS